MSVQPIANNDRTRAEHAQRIADSPDQAAKVAGLGRTIIFKALASGELPSLKIGRRRLIMREDLHAWLLSKREPR